MAKKNLFVFLGAYGSEADARADYDVVKELHLAGAVGTYDAAVITKTDDGKVHVNKDELPTRHGAWTGVAAGALLGIIFPPSIIGTAAVGGLTGGVIGHLWHGLSRSDVKELGEGLDAGEAALIVIGDDKVADEITKLQLKAIKEVKKEIDADADELKSELDEAAKSL